MTTETRTNYPNGRYNIELLAGTEYGAKRASVTKQGERDFLVIFGFMDRDWDGRPEFRVAPYRSGGAYRTEAGALRAARAWMSN